LPRSSICPKLTYVRIIFLSDIHGNLEALESVREEIKADAPDAVYCLGDVVGYGADPERCWRIVAEEGWPTVMGNHDEAILNPQGLLLMNPVAKKAIEWTAKKLSREGKKWLGSLPDEIKPFEGSVLSHGLPLEPMRWVYSDDPHFVTKVFKERSEFIFWVGHLHYAHAWKLDPESERLVIHKMPEKLELGDEKWVINVGSVGQPRDGDHRASYVLYDTDTRVVTYRRVQYDTAEAARKIVDAGLPEVLAHRLFLGQ